MLSSCDHRTKNDNRYISNKEEEIKTTGNYQIPKTSEEEMKRVTTMHPNSKYQVADSSSLPPDGDSGFKQVKLTN